EEVRGSIPLGSTTSVHVLLKGTQIQGRSLPGGRFAPSNITHFALPSYSLGRASQHHSASNHALILSAMSLRRSSRNSSYSGIVPSSRDSGMQPRVKIRAEVGLVRDAAVLLLARSPARPSL